MDLRDLALIEPWVRAHQRIILLWAGALLVLSFVLGQWRTHTRRGSHGSARFGGWWTALWGGLLRHQGYPLGRYGGLMLRSLHAHILQVGGTGMRKDRSYNLPFTVRCPWSLLIVDVKDQGENWQLCGALRQQRGPVWRLCPGDPMSHAWNPLHDMVRVHTDHEFRDVTYLMQSLMAPQEKDVKPSDQGQFFEHQGVVAGRAVVLYVLHDLPYTRATLLEAYDLMHEPEALLAAMAQHPQPEVKRQGTFLRHLLDNSPRQFDGEWSTAKKVLELFSDPQMHAITSHCDFHVADLQCHAHPATLYLGALSPIALSSYLAPFYRLLIESAYRHLSSLSSRRWPLTFLLNEFNELGWMDIIERAPAHARSSDIWFVAVVQNLEQLFGTYGYDTPLWGHCRVKIFHAPDTDTTAKRLSEMIGEETITVTNRTWGQRRTSHATGRKLLDIPELFGLGEQVVVWTGGKHPFLLRKPRYWKGKG